MREREKGREERDWERERERETEEMRSRTGALRDDTPTRHPDNVPGQDLCLSRKWNRQ